MCIRDRSRVAPVHAGSACSVRRFSAHIALLTLIGAAVIGCVDERRGRSGRLEPLTPPPTLGALDGGSPAPEGAERPRGEITLATEDAPAPPERMPAVTIVQPKQGQAIAQDKLDNVEIKLDVRDFAMQRGGAHVNVVLDNGPYRAVYDPSDRLRLGDFAPDEPLAEGTHVLVAFPVNEAHVAIRSERGKNPVAVV